MAMGSIELATIARLQDYTTIKQNEDNRGLAQQSNLVQQMDHDNQQKTRQVTESDNAQWHQKNPNAKEKGNGNYAGDGGRNRKKQKESDGRVLVNGREHFDIKI